jgi:hypothetical protein
MEQREKDSKFIKQLCLLTLVVFAVSVALRNTLTVWWPAIVCFFFIVSIVMYLLSEKAKKKDMRKFANFYMGATVVKMMLYLGIIFVYILNFKEDGKRFAITFLCYYLIFSIFETYKLSRKEKKSDGK